MCPYLIAIEALDLSKALSLVILVAVAVLTAITSIEVDFTALAVGQVRHHSGYILRVIGLPIEEVIAEFINRTFVPLIHST